MDEHGLDMQVLSLTSPGIQAEKDTRVAVTNALKVNDFLKTVIDQHPTHFGGFAALPLQDPKAAADELERTVKQYGFSGGLINAHTQGKYLDHPDFNVVWERAVTLDVPLYLHPAVGVDVPHIFKGHEELIGPMWSWGVDTGTHAMRIIFGKVFDRYPKAKLLLGHMGEGLPYALWRMDSRLAPSTSFLRPTTHLRKSPDRVPARPAGNPARVESAGLPAGVVGARHLHAAERPGGQAAAVFAGERGADGVHMVDHPRRLARQPETVGLAGPEVAALDGVLDEPVDAVVVDLAAAGGVDAALGRDAVGAPGRIMESEALDVIAEFAERRRAAGAGQSASRRRSR